MLPVVAVLVPWDVAICVVIVCQNANINMSGLGVNGTVGDCAIAGGCAGGDSDCNGDVLWLCQRRGGEAAEQVSYNADINQYLHVGELFLCCRWLCYRRWLCRWQQ